MEREGVDKEDKEDEGKKKKSIAFKASSSSKNKGKSKKEASSDDEDASDIDDEAMALLVHKMGKFMMCKKEKRSHEGVCEVMLQVQEPRSHCSGLSIQ
jgi:hypothetical protein